MDYFVQSSIARDDTATWQDREDGSQPLAVTLTRTDDGSDDAVHAAHVTVDLDVTDDLPVTINQNGTRLYAVDAPRLAKLIEAGMRGNIVALADALTQVGDAARG